VAETAADRRRTTVAVHTILPTVAITAVALLLYGSPVPRLSEELYLPLVKRVADASYLRGDWTFSGDFREHWLFDHVFAPLAGPLSISTFGWIGRLVFWPLLAFLLVRLGTRLRLSEWQAAAALVLWLVANQALMGTEWILGTFEAKTVAYAFLLGAFLAVTHRRVPWALALLGITLSFHPAVGLWGAWGVGLALLLLPETRRTTLRWCWLGAVLPIPGIVGGLSAAGAASQSLQRFLVLDVIPYHLDPFFGGDRLAPLQVALRVATLAGMLGFNLWAYRRDRADFVQRFLAAFQVIAAIPFVLAFPARALHAWEYLRLMPLRSFPLFVPLIFFFQVMSVSARWRAGTPHERAQARRRHRRSARLLVAVAVVVALLLTSPIAAAPRLVSRNLAAWTEHDSVAAAFGWVRDHVPAHATCIVPVDRQDAFARGERPIVANWQAVRYDRLGAWKRRIDALVGGPGYFTEGSGWRGDLSRLRTAYDSLTERQVRAVARRYGATCLVSETPYSFPVLHREGTVKIYRLDGAAGS
jgi:hypothetical protein